MARSQREPYEPLYDRQEATLDARLTRIVVLAVTAVWVASFVADIFIPAYDPSPYIHAAMMAVVGAATARHIYMRNGGGPNK